MTSSCSLFLLPGGQLASRCIEARAVVVSGFADARLGGAQQYSTIASPVQQQVAEPAG